MIKLQTAIIQVVEAILMTTLGYAITGYLVATMATNMGVSMPSWYTAVVGIVWVVLCFIIIIWTLQHVTGAAQKD